MIVSVVFKGILKFSGLESVVQSDKFSFSSSTPCLLHPVGKYFPHVRNTAVVVFFWFSIDALYVNDS